MNNWSKYKGYGVLLHISAIPSQYGIGDIGHSGFEFLKWLNEVGANTWQVLPTGLSDETNCPYACFSAFGGNPLFLCLESLKQNHLITSELKKYPQQSIKSNRIDFDNIHKYKDPYLKEAYQTFSTKNLYQEEYLNFKKESEHWLDDLTLFLVLTEKHGHNWKHWPNNLSQYGSKEVEIFKKK